MSDDGGGWTTDNCRKVWSYAMTYAQQSDPDILIHPRQGRREPPLPGRALLLVNPSEAAFALQLFTDHAPKRRTLYNSNLLVDKDHRFCLAGPALGAPAAGLVMEKLIALGVSDVLLISCCGVIDPDLVIGDRLVGLAAVPGEGVSRYYVSDYPVYPSAEATQSLRGDLQQRKISFKDGSLWSTDAPYRERRSELFGLREQYGISGIDMEFSALCAIAAFRNISISGLFIVSDELWGRDWRPGFTSSAFRNEMHAIIEEMINCAEQKEQKEC